jgi:Double zinc ribbon
MADKKQLEAHMLTRARRRYPRKHMEQGLKLALLLGVGVAVWTFSSWGLVPAAVITLLWYEVTYLAYCFLSAMRDNHNHQQRENRGSQQTRIKELEGELGLPVVMVGECWNCHKPLAADAKFCTYCGKSSEKPTAKVCKRCQTRNPLDGVYCIECGKKLPAAS